MKKTIVVITKEYWPISNGTVTCISNIINELKEKYDIKLFCSNTNSLKSTVEIVDGITVFQLGNIFNYYYNILNYLDDVLLFKRYRKVQHLLSFLAYLLVGVHSVNTEKNWSKIWKIISKFTELEKVEYVLSIAMPYSNVYIASKLISRYPDLKVGHILFDLYADNPALLKEDKNQDSYKRRVKEEEYWFEFSTRVFVTKEMLNCYSINHLENLSKFRVIGLPMIYSQRKYIEHKREIVKEIKVVYTGQFYKNIRNSDSLKRLIENLWERNDDLNFHILGGRFDVSKYNNELKSRILFYGNVTKEKALRAINSADVLINISNNSLTQIPSKIYEYISTGKPIINIYSIDDDLCVSILNNYPLSLSVNVADLSKVETLEKINGFILYNRGMGIDFEIIRGLYAMNTPSFVSDIIDTELKSEI